MASLELVNAVQRTLEKDGILAEVRATLRAGYNLLLYYIIISLLLSILLII